MGTTNWLYRVYIKYMEETNMREVTVKEFATAFTGKTLEINADDRYGVTIQMSKARISYDEVINDLTFVAGNYSCNDGIGSVTYDSEIIESILFNEDTGEYTISFNEYMADITVREFK